MSDEKEWKSVSVSMPLASWEVAALDDPAFMDSVRAYKDRLLDITSRLLDDVLTDTCEDPGCSTCVDDGLGTGGAG